MIFHFKSGALIIISGYIADEVPSFENYTIIVAFFGGPDLFSVSRRIYGNG